MQDLHGYNEPIAAVIVGLLLSVSAGFRIMLPLLATEPTLIILSVAAVMETIVHFIPAAGTWLKAMATPLAFVAGTLLMAVPLGDKNPLYQWTLAAVIGGGAATLTHLGVTGLRALSAPANVASLGTFGIVWNIAELVGSALLAALGGLCVVAGWVLGAVVLVALAALLIVIAIQGIVRFRHAPSAST
jgi:hypothetical protein